MSDTPDMKPGMIGWNELVTPDPEACEAFFTQLVGWTTESFDMASGGRYTIFKQDDQPVGGLMPMQHIEMKDCTPHWMPYLTVDNVDAACTKCKQLGGKVVLEPMDVPNIGRFAIISDPSEAALGLAQYLAP